MCVCVCVCVRAHAPCVCLSASQFDNDSVRITTSHSQRGSEGSLNVTRDVKESKTDTFKWELFSSTRQSCSTEPAEKIKTEKSSQKAS